MADSPVFNASNAVPSAQDESTFNMSVGQNQQTSANDLLDFKQQSGQAANLYNQVTAPQLQGSVASNGNWYSDPGQKQIGQGAAAYQNQQTDLASSVQRNLDQLTQQSNWASIGLIV